ncbi:acyl-CoA dehydrogenase family protein [Pantoea sp. App145]|uniref:acyl-CoA dehydrogenase family protein n=1 Tax=Pantoea sp. App145 TaxID=3071567 RepID=UPI003A8095E7
MSQIDKAWGAGPSESYERLAERFRPLFARIREGVINRELKRELPIEQLDWLKEAGFTALRIPKKYGGSAVSLPELFNLLIELGEADSNLVQALRGHFGFIESLINSDNLERQAHWLPLLGRGDIVGLAWSETGDALQLTFSTQLVESEGQWTLNGKKFYTTGSLYADWIDIGLQDDEGNLQGLIVSRHAQGVTVLDDWNGFGQTLTASGTAIFEQVVVSVTDVYQEPNFRYATGFYQLVHLATLAGIGRAQSDEVALHVAQRTRTYSNGNAPRASQDVQILQVVGKVRSAAYSSSAIVLKSAEALQRAFEVSHEEEEQKAQVNAIAELEVSQALNVVTDLLLTSSTLLFDALGASATLKPHALDRFWRNVRTLSSHNPRIYKDRIVGDFAVNGTLPPYQWRIGVAVENTGEKA